MRTLVECGRNKKGGKKAAAEVEKKQKKAGKQLYFYAEIY